MNPQYLPPQQAQYGMQPGSNYPGPGMYPPQAPSTQQQYRPPFTQPQLQQPAASLGPSSAPPNAFPGGQAPLTCSLPPQQRGPTPQSHFTGSPNPNQIAGQMANMNLNGVQRPSYPPMGSAPPLTKPIATGYPTASPQYPQINGAGPGSHAQMNGLPEASGPGRGGTMQTSNMQPRYPPMNDGLTVGSAYGGPQSGFPPQPQNYVPQDYQPKPGYAPQPGYPQAPQQQKKLDPDQMPSPMQVMEEDRGNKSGIFYTNQKGQVPPLVTTKFIVQDQGNCSPRFIRSTMYSVPINADMMKQTSVPFGLVISPMAEVVEQEQPPPVVDMGELGPVRCLRCKAYMCPNMQFIDGGRRFHCLLCRQTTEVPAEYFQHLDHTGMRVDRFQRAELVLGAYEFLATREYCKDNTFPKPPALIFLIDVSYNNVKSGLVSLMCSQMKQFLQNLPREHGQTKSPMRVGFITYNTSVHFYNINPNLGQPQMMVVGDTQEMFMPLLDGFLVDPFESETVIDTLMMQIPVMFAETRETETILAPAIQAGLEALRASGCAGKLLIFHSSLPTADAPGKLKNRDDRKVLGTEKEKTVLTPQNTVYNNLGQDCVASGVSVDLFIFNNSYIDLATIGQISRLTGGEIYKYTYFQADLDGERLISDVEKNVSRLCAFDSVMRVRTSTGIRPTDFHGHFFMSNTTDIELASIDPNKALAIEIKHDDKLSEEEGVYIQAALLYTSISGVRKIRVLNLALKSCSQMGDLYRTCDLDTMINFFSKQALFKLSDNPPKGVKETLVSRSAQILACYRKNCASPSSAGQLILPECMKLLPLYINCILKSDALSGGSDMTVDDRWFTMSAVTIMDIPSSVVYFYPRLLPLHDLEDGNPEPIRCSIDRMVDSGVYLLENGIYMFLWLGLSVASEWVMSVFGVPSTSQVDIEKSRLPILNNPLSENVRGLISSINSSRHRSMRLTLVRQRDKMEVVMKHFLIEDRGLDGSSSYVDFLCHMHKEIRTILS